jgi:hypothetical protein
VNPGWVAGGVRARLLLERRAGPALARTIAGTASLSDALAELSRSSYPVSGGSEPRLEVAQRSVAAAVALECRVLAAWLNRDAAVSLRALASWFELANIEDRIAYLSGAELRAPFELGMLASAWPTASASGSVDGVRHALARSAWGDPGSDDPSEIQLWLRLAWARRVARQTPAARGWAEGAVAILLAAEMFVAERRFAPTVAGRLGLGSSWPAATTISGLRQRLPRSAAWALDAVEDITELWRAEAAWWRTVEREAEAMTRGRLDRPEVVVGTVALLALDGVRVNTALAVASRVGSVAAREVLDALC